MCRMIKKNKLASTCSIGPGGKNAQVMENCTLYCKL